MYCLIGLLFPGIVVAIVVWDIVAKGRILHGLVAWGFLTGLGTFTLLNGLVYYLLVAFHRQRDVFYGSSKCPGDGPIGIDFLAWAIGLFAGFVVYAGLSIRSAWNLSVDIPRYWPKNGNHWLVGVLIVLSCIPGIFILREAYQRYRIRAATNNLALPVTEWNLQEIGSLSQPGVIPFDPFPDYVYDMQISTDGRWALLQHEHQTDLFDLSTLQVSQTFMGEEMTTSFSPDGSMLLVIIPPFFQQSPVFYVTLYDLSTGAILWQNSALQTFSGLFLSDGKELLLADRNTSWRIQVVDGRILGDIDLTAYTGRSASPDTTLFAVQNGEEITVFNASQSQIIAELLPGDVGELHDWQYKLLTFLTNEEILISLIPPDGNSYQRLIWNFQTGQTNILPYPPENIKTSPDGRYIIQNHGYCGGRIRNVKDSQTNQNLPWPVEAAVGAAAFTPDQKLLMVATFDGYLRFFVQSSP